MVEDQRRLDREYHSHQYFEQTLVAKYFQMLKRPVAIARAVKLLDFVVAKNCYLYPFQVMKQRVSKIEVMHQDWFKYREQYLKSQVLIRWREYSVKRKLAVMFFKRLVLRRMRSYVYSKNREIPFQFWSRYRQILFLKVLRYNCRKSKK